MPERTHLCSDHPAAAASLSSDYLSCVVQKDVKSELSADYSTAGDGKAVCNLPAQHILRHLRQIAADDLELPISAIAAVPKAKYDLCKRNTALSGKFTFILVDCNKVC